MHRAARGANAIPNTRLTSEEKEHL